MQIDYRLPDEKFNLRTVSDAEIFNSLKGDIVQAIKTFKGFEGVTSNDVKLNARFIVRKEKIARDCNLYPNIILPLSVNLPLGFGHVNVYIDPFNIELAQEKYDAPKIKDEELSAAFEKFMLERFPDADYLSEKSKYNMVGDMIERKRYELLSFVPEGFDSSEM